MSDAAIIAYARDVQTMLNLLTVGPNEKTIDNLVARYNETRARVKEMTERILLSE